MVTFLIGDMLTGKRIQFLPVIAGSWTEAINDAGEISATVSVRDGVVRRLGLYNSAAVGKAFLAAVEGDVVLQAGPIWDHDYDRDAGKLTLRAAGLLSYFDHRVVLPVLNGRLPSDKTTDTRFMPAAPSDPDYPWPSDTRSSWQGIIATLLTQALSWPQGNVPLTVPVAIAGTEQRAYAGADVASVGGRIREITQLENGPEIRMTPQWTVARDGIAWVAEIGTPTQPLIFSAQSQVFYLGNARSSLSKVSVKTSGLSMGAQAFAAGGRAADKTLVAAATLPTLGTAGYPLLELVDSSRATVQDLSTLQKFANEMVRRGAWPTSGWSFTHDARRRPFLSSFRAGDNASVRVLNDPYLPQKEHSMRILRRSGDATGNTVALTMSPA